MHKSCTRQYRGAVGSSKVFEPEVDKFFRNIKFMQGDSFAGKFSIKLFRYAPAFAIEFEFGKINTSAACHIEKSFALGRSRIGKITECVHVG